MDQTEPPQTQPRPRTVQAVERANTLLRTISTGKQPQTVRELARECGLNRSTAWRLLLTLEQQGMIDRDPLTQRYQVGFSAIQIAAAAGHDSLVRRARAVLEQLVNETQEMVSLAVPERFSLRYIDQVEPPNVPCPNWLGRVLPLHATSSGKAFLAWLPDDERRAVLPAQLQRYTPRTITDHDTLAVELATARQLGYATCIGEHEEFSNGVSAPVIGTRSQPIAIVNLWGPTQRVPPDRLPTLGQAALQAVQELATRIT
jgi:DNA-binding IclR family transcriptional regulator